MAASLIEYVQGNLDVSRFDHIPGDLGLPFIGQTFDALRDPLALLNDCHRRYGETFKIRGGGEVVVVLLGAEANRYVLVEEAENFSNEKGWDFVIGDLFKKGLLLRDGSEHRHHRSILQSAFNRGSMVGYLDRMEPLIKKNIKRWQGRQTLTVFDSMKELTLNVAGRVFMGLEVDEDFDRINRAIVDVVKASSSAFHIPLPFSKYWFGLQARRVLEEFFSKVIAERREKPTDDMLGQLCVARNEQGATLSDEDIINHIIFILMAAHDTTTSAVTSLVYHLAQNQAWQKKLRHESEEFLRQPFEYTRLKELEQLGWAIKEALRMHPPLAIFLRKTMKPMRYKSIELPADTRVAVVPYFTHYSPEYWSSADKFDPERFSGIRAEHKKVAGAYVPFGAGKHLCIGMNFAEMQAKVILSHFLKNFSWSVSAGYQYKTHLLPIAEPVDGLQVRLEIN